MILRGRDEDAVAVGEAMLTVTNKCDDRNVETMSDLRRVKLTTPNWRLSS
jgi:hypothetical protein